MTGGFKAGRHPFFLFGIGQHAINLRSWPRKFDRTNKFCPRILRKTPIFCEAFRLDPAARSLDLTAEQLDPFLKDAPPSGLQSLDLETRSLLQVLFFVSHGIEVPQEHLACGLAPYTRGYDGRPFDWQQVLGGLFHVCSVKSKKPPADAQVAVRYQGYWFYIDERDRYTKATFALLLEVSRLELESTEAQAPMFTLPLGGGSR